MSAPENQKRVLAALHSEAVSPSQAAQLKPAAAAGESGTGGSDDCTSASPTGGTSSELVIWRKALTVDFHAVSVGARLGGGALTAPPVEMTKGISRWYWSSGLLDEWDAEPPALLHGAQ